MRKSIIAVFIMPAVLTYVLVYLYPTTRTIVMSLFNVEFITDAVSTWTFAGFGNYAKLFSSPLFMQTLSNIMSIWLFGGIAVMLLALLFAVILTSGVRLKRFFRAAIYLPNVISAIAMATMWIQYVYNQRYGLFNNILATLGIEEVAWTGPELLFTSMLIAYCFGMVGYHMLIFMSGIEKIPNDIYEAATIDGANNFKKFFRVTLPLLKSSLKTNIVLWSISTTAFFIWSQMFSPQNMVPETATPMVYMYQLVFGATMSVAARDAGAGAAIGVILSLIIVAIFLITNRAIRNNDLEF